MSSSDFYVTCSCGNRVAVTLGMAGMSVPCRCGASVPVPTLGELKRQGGADARPIEKAAGRNRAILAAGMFGVLLAAAVAIGVLIRGFGGPRRPPPSQAPVMPAVTTTDSRPQEMPVPKPTGEGQGSPMSLDEYFAALKNSRFAKSAREVPQEVFGGDRTASVQEPTGTVKDPVATFSAFCSTCHVLPTPDVEPKYMWPYKIRQMYRYARGPRPQPPERIPPISAAIDYWSSRAPAVLPMPDDAFQSPSPPLPFERRLVTLKAIPGPPGISCVNFVRFGDDRPIQLLLSDMGQGQLVLWTPSDAAQPERVLARIRYPVNARVVDLDGDGLRDLLVADLGEFLPVDTDRGSLVWLRNRGSERFEPVTLIGGLGRVNDVQAADFDGDGDLDIVLGVFGNLRTGMVLYLENCTKDWAHPDFEPLPLDYRTGTSDSLVADLNRDGHPDLVVLQSQEHDHVLAFLNRGWGSFWPETIFQAPHPRWGSTGIRLIDLDGDGDLDVLYNHGDSMQFPPIPRPYHGVSWLENQGRFPFAYHRLAHLPGAQTSLAADLDGDGRQDVVSSSFVPGFDPNWPDAGRMDTIIWLRQVSAGQFERYSLETRLPYHAAGALGDYDGDGDVDVVMGNFYIFPFKNVAWDACLTVLENRSGSKPPGANP